MVMKIWHEARKQIIQQFIFSQITVKVFQEFFIWKYINLRSWGIFFVGFVAFLCSKINLSI